MPAQRLLEGAVFVSHGRGTPPGQPPRRMRDAASFLGLWVRGGAGRAGEVPQALEMWYLSECRGESAGRGSDLGSRNSWDTR